jgi:predicted naringenin-chalcone synthase
MSAAGAPALLLGLATSVPPHRSDQRRAASFVSRVLQASEPSRERDQCLLLVERIYTRSGIEARQSVLADYLAADPAAFDFFPRNWALEPFPSTARRMRVYEGASVDLAEAACRGALDHAGLCPGDVDHLVLSTCTGFFAPGPDVLLLTRLGLRPGVSRTLLGFMGCHAGFNGMRTAGQILRSDSEAVVLQVSVELCTLHFQKRPIADFHVANCLFSDGCAALVWGGRTRAAAPPLAQLGATLSHVGADSLGDMTWHVGDTGFEMRLSTRVPAALATEAPGFVDALLVEDGLLREEIGTWALHPGGWRIVEALGGALGLREHETAASLGVLRDHGNMSSATVFFVLDRLLGGGALLEPTVALGFGPGLTIEGAVLRPVR